MATNERGSGRASGWLRALRVLLSLLIVAGIVASSGAVSYHWLQNRPRAKRKRPQKEASLVEVTAVRSEAFRVNVNAMGTVVAAREVTLAPRVGGEVTWRHDELVVGGRFPAGQAVVSIDPRDYELAVAERRAELARRVAELEQLKRQVAQRSADVARAQSDLRLEMGQQDLAKQEQRLLGEVLSEADREFVLRKPQLAAAKANCVAAEAARAASEAACKAAEASKASAEVALEQAKLDLARAKVCVPFNSVVTQESVELGSQVSPGQAIATLIGTDEAWVEISVPVNELRWIRIPAKAGERGSPVRLTHESAWGPSAFRVGHIRRMAPSLEPRGRMARVIVAVEDPLCLRPENAGHPALILGAYVRAVIEGEELNGTIAVPRVALREGTQAWVAATDGTLDIRELKIAWHGRHTVCVQRGLRAGDRVITSDLAAPIQGMALRVREAKKTDREAPNASELEGGVARKSQ